ncbi:MAG: SPOR domain-containing protein [Proteobacteria bacterium]|nr:SPOR domain-containing protein [Pseudomonadota bacterium]
MELSRISRLFLAVAILTLGGCSLVGGSGDVKMPDGIELRNAQVMQITDLQRRLAVESARATAAEKVVQRARAEVDWLARAAQEEPQLRAKIAELEEENARLIADNQRIVVLEENLRQLEIENDRLSRALRGDWNENPEAQSSGADAATSEVETLPETAEYGEGNYAVHLASYRSKEASLDGWRRLQGLYPALLGELSGHFAIFDVPSLGGRFYRLKAGPFEGASGARKLCRDLNNAGEYCVVTVFDGEQLSE